MMKLSKPEFLCGVVTRWSKTEIIRTGALGYVGRYGLPYDGDRGSWFGLQSNQAGLLMDSFVRDGTSDTEPSSLKEWSLDPREIKRIING